MLAEVGVLHLRPLFGGEVRLRSLVLLERCQPDLSHPFSPHGSTDDLKCDEFADDRTRLSLERPVPLDRTQERNGFSPGGLSWDAGARRARGSGRSGALLTRGSRPLAVCR